MMPIAETVAEHREKLEKWAESDLPLADDMAALLEEADDAPEAISP